jgi:hypothetical protein
VPPRVGDFLCSGKLAMLETPHRLTREKGKGTIQKIPYLFLNLFTKLLSFFMSR